MACLIVTEAAIFTIFVVAYLFYVGKSTSGPQPREVLDLPILAVDACCRSSTFTIVIAVRALRRGTARRFTRGGCSRSSSACRSCSAPALEWPRLIVTERLTIRTNLFGTTYYSLVGLHAFHVTIGLSVIGLMLRAGAARRTSTREHAERTEVLLLVLAFRRRRVGRRVPDRLRDRTLEANGTRPALDDRRARADGVADDRGVRDHAGMFAGLVTNALVTVVGVIATLWGAVGWFRDVLPRRAPRAGPRRAGPGDRTLARDGIAYVQAGAGPHRARLPVEIYPYSAGIKGGIAGGLSPWRCSPRCTA